MQVMQEQIMEVINIKGLKIMLIFFAFYHKIKSQKKQNVLAS